MQALLPLFTANILPIFLTAGAGFLLGRFVDVEPRTVSRVCFYIFSPCLVFTLITSSQIGGDDFLLIMSYAVAATLLVGLLAALVGIAMRMERRLLIAVVITAMFANSGNFGLSVNNFAFGEDALAYASIFFATSSILVYTVGVFVASMGEASLKEALIGLLRVPAIYGLALAFIFNAFDLSLPLPLDRSVNLLAHAAIPSMLVLLGLQLQRVVWNGQVRAMILANGMRLAMAPIIAIGLSILFGLQGPARQAGILEASMPTAVFATILATEYDVEPAFVTTVVTTTTLLSPLTLTPLLAFLGT
ncbi:MAG: AEC family transporter [Chloroflexi bacterium]|nr:MAG: AEC family transporter [Chloroflexota bacterium]MBL1193428.1 AEC family transporter [Chloroflexota bacterium]NOH10720.1 AEC family transporter [Chloroflexota bacterium]